MISEDEINSLPHDGDVSHVLPSFPTPHASEILDSGEPNNLIESSGFPNIQQTDVNQTIQNNIRNLDHPESQQTIEAGDWPEMSLNPLSEFDNEGIICKAFPVLFPYGRGDIYEPRMHRIPKLKYFQYLMEYHDGRFANDLRFPYYAYNTIARWNALNCGNVYICCFVYL